MNFLLATFLLFVTPACAVEAPGDRLIPNPMHVETTVQVILPPEVDALVRDLHNDRQLIGIGIGILISCVVWNTLKRK